MQKVRVARDDLLAVLRQNREAHRDIFLKAQEGFRKEVVRRLEERLEDARRGKSIDLHIGLVMPMDQTRDYDRVIRMLEMSVDGELELTQQEFAMYVMDDWGWKQQFTATNSTYIR